MNSNGLLEECVVVRKQTEFGVRKFEQLSLLCHIRGLWLYSSHALFSHLNAPMSKILLVITPHQCLETNTVICLNVQSLLPSKHSIYIYSVINFSVKLTGGRQVYSAEFWTIFSIVVLLVSVLGKKEYLRQKNQEKTI